MPGLPRFELEMEDTTEPMFAGGELLAGKYRVERMIGQGGMGVVLAARHEGLQTDVAIKLLREVALQHTDVVGRFMREARAAVSLRSEHVARVFDVGKLDDGRPYIVMERLEGKDLGEVIEQGPMLSPSEAVDYVLQACEAIAEAHRAGIVHRDLKPKNLFLTHAVHGRPLVKVLDFGISKVDPARSPGEMQLTRTTEVIGSPSYMSPEQLRSSRSVDARTDIWALGVILYELLTRRVPFYAETVTELVLVVVTEREPPIRAFRQDVPEGLEAVVSRCLHKQPDHRFQSVVELVQALEPFAQGVQATVTERVRAVAGESFTRPMPPMAASHSGHPPPAASSNRVNVHGGTSVAWGETQSQVTHNHIPGVARGGLIASIAIAGVVSAAAVAGGAVWYMKHANAQPPPPVAAGEQTPIPLPPGRKDLPPLAPLQTAEAPKSATPTGTPDDTPPSSALPETRKLPPTTPVRPAQQTRPAPAKPPGSDKTDKPDDLSNIGRR
jgi:serine/threonine-protein kinase